MRSLIISIAVLLTLPTVSAAGVRTWLGVSGSWATYWMSDVNHDVRDINAALAGSGLSMDEIGHGLSFGIEAGVETRGPVSIGLGYERLQASSEVSDTSGTLRYRLPANAVRGSVAYRLGTERRRSALVGFGLGRVTEAGSVEFVIPGLGAASSEPKGSGAIFEAFAAGDWWAAPQIALFGSAGYRYAKIGLVKVNGQTVFNEDGSRYEIDYSGVVVRLGLKAALTR